jgi:hypothetical protein
VNLREAIGEYAAHYGRCQEVIGWGGEGAERIRRQFGEVEERLDRVVKVAEAAIAYAEYQASNPGVEVKDYFRELCRLWDAFMAARAKAREVGDDQEQ